MTESRPVTIDVPESHPLVELAGSIPWLQLYDLVLPDLKKTAKGMFWLGRKLKLRIHLAVYLLQKMTDKTDRHMEWELRDNAAFRIFCGFGIVDKWHVPDHTKIEEFRSRLSPDTQQQIANLMARNGVVLGFAGPAIMDVDSTIQEANMTFPSDASLLVKLSVMAGKVHRFLIKKFYNEESNFDLKAVKSKARAYFFSLNKSLEEKKARFEALYWSAYFQIIKVTGLSFTKASMEGLPWNVRRAAVQIMEHGSKFLEDVKVFIDEGRRVPGKVFSFHLKEVAAFNKGKAGKGLQFGRNIQMGRIGGNFMIAGASTSVRMEDKSSVKPMVEEHQRLFGEDTLKSFGTDKGYYKKANQLFLDNLSSLEETALQKPGIDPESLPEADRETLIRLSDRRSGIEPLIGHIKQGGQLGRSRMKTDQTSLAAGYGAVAGFNLRQTMRHQMGKKIKAM
jgi:hypothetical protein